MPGWPKSVLDIFNWPSVVLSDIDGDLDLEVIVWAGKGGRLFAWHHDGQEVLDGDGNPSTDGVFYRVFDTIFNYSSPAVADLDQDGQKEIIVAVNLSGDTSGEVIVVENDGTVKDGWPFATGSMANPSMVTASPAVADIDNDGLYEVIIAAARGGGQVYVLRHDGTSQPGWPRQAAALSSQARTSSPVPVDLEGDGLYEVFFASSDGILYGWNYQGATLPGFPVTYATGLLEATQSTPAIVDIDGDGAFELLFGDETGKLHGYNHDGTQAAGFPIQLNGEVRSTPAVWDIDDDGLVEIVLTGWDANVYVWEMPATFDPLRAPWPLFRHDSRNTGWTNVGVLPIIGVDDPLEGGGSPIVQARVHAPRPNPFNPRTTLAIDVPGEGSRQVDVGIYDVQGRLVRRLLRGVVDAGSYELTWDGRSKNGQMMGAGVYLYRVTIDRFEATGKLVMVK